MAINQPEQVAKWIADLADRGRVSFQGTPDPELWAALSGVLNAEALTEEPGELMVSLDAAFARVPAVTRILLMRAADGDRLSEVVRHAALNGFVPDPDTAPPDCASDWLLLRRSDSLLQLRIDTLEGTAASLEAEHQRLREALRETRRELHGVQNSPAWHAVRWYRGWLGRRRERKSLPFRVFEKVTAAALRTAVPHRVETDRNDDPVESHGQPTAPAARFTRAVLGGDAWQRVFQGLAAFADVESDLESPIISIITPLWNTKPVWLAEAAVSVFDQTCTDWEWCIVDDGSTNTAFQPVLDAICAASPRVRFMRTERNGGISRASNEALKMARGAYVCCLDHDDLLHPEALELCVEQLTGGNLDAVYTDSNKASEATVLDEPFYKPDWSPEYFRGVMYVGHVLCVRREPALDLGGFDPRFDGVQDYEFFLRYSERNNRIGHIPRILYHWRKVEGSTALSTAAKKDITLLQQRAVAGQLDRLKMPARAVRGVMPHRVTVEPGPRRDSPRVSIIIPTRDAAEMLSKCLDSIFRLSTYQNLQVICADNETTDEKALALMKRRGVDRVLCPGKFNFSAVNNQTAKMADGEFLVFLNNDIEVITRDWIEQMLYHAEQDDAGAVGALLVYPNRTVQHCGIALGFRGTADHILRSVDSTGDGYAGTLGYAHECSAVTAACLMMRKSLFEEVGGFSEHYFTAYQDVDLCLRLHASGKRNIYTPRAVLVHHESYSRKSYYDLVDRNLLLDSWEDMIEEGDPFYSVNFSRTTTDYQVSLNADRGLVPPRVPLYSFGKPDRVIQTASKY